jgi:hypothetical protein
MTRRLRQPTPEQFWAEIFISLPFSGKKISFRRNNVLNINIFFFDIKKYLKIYFLNIK